MGNLLIGLISAIYAEKFGRRIKGSRVEAIEWCDRIPEVEQMETTYALVNEFLSS